MAKNWSKERDFKSRKHYGSVALPGEHSSKINYGSIAEDKSKRNESETGQSDRRASEVLSPVQLLDKSGCGDQKSPGRKIRARLSDLGLPGKPATKDKALQLGPKRKLTERPGYSKLSLDHSKLSDTKKIRSHLFSDTKKSPLRKKSPQRNRHAQGHTGYKSPVKQMIKPIPVETSFNTTTRKPDNKSG